MRKLTLSLAILAAMMPGRGFSLGLGEIELNSALNQELDAEIEVLSAEQEDAEQLIIKLASREAFARAGIDRPYLLQQLKFKAVVKNGKPFVQISTQKPVREPFLSFLVEIDWPHGHLLREYTLLLDPPVYNSGAAPVSTPSNRGDERPFIDPADQQRSQSVNPVDNSRPAVGSFDSPAMTQSGVVTAPAVATREEADGTITYTAAPQYTDISGEHRVQANDTLWSLSNRMKPDNSVSVEQMMLALVRKNPEAFIEENINGLKRGYILRMPDRESIAAIDRKQALAIAREHGALWRQYREAQSGVTPATSLESDIDGGSADAGMDVETDAQLSIVSASEAEGSDSAGSTQDQNASELKRLRNQLSLAQESLESERLEKNDLQNRLADLEQRVQSVLEKSAVQVDEAELAKLQQDLEGARQDSEQPAVDLDIEPEQVAIDETAEDVVAEDMVADETPAEDMPAEPVIDDMASSEEPVTDAPAEGEEPALFVDESDTSETSAEAEPVEAVSPVEQQTDTPAFVQPKKQKSFIEKLLDDPSMLAAIAGGLLAVFALIGVLLRRRRVNKEEQPAEVDDPFKPNDTDITVKADSVDLEATGELDLSAIPDGTDTVMDFGDTHIEAPEEESDDAIISLDDELAEASADENRDDVLAEADVYLAYGIYQQAEELLNNAISKNPERDDYRMKLLETHFAGKNSGEFAKVAADAHQRKGADKSYWDRVVVMGRDLCPDNELFTGVGEIPDIDDLLPEKPATTDLELDAGTDAAATDLDLGDSLSDFETEAESTQTLNEPVDLGLDLPEEAGEAESDEMDELLADSELEFDLGDFGEELEDAGSVEEPSPELATDDALSDLDVSMDLGEELEEEAEKSTDNLEIDEDFSLDFEASDLGFDEEGLEQDESESEATEDASTNTEIALDEDLDLAIDADSVSEVVDTTDELDMDMDIDLDVDSSESVDITSDLEQSVSLGDDSDDFDISSLSEEVDEVSTKLDLAKAYIDMGDNEGAKSILEEVKQEGNAEQQQQAEELLTKAS